MAAFCDASSGNDVVSAGGIVRGAGGGGVAFEVTHADATMLTVVTGLVFHSPASVDSGGSLSGL